MRRDPTEFRERFAAWKAGEKVYENGLPAYGGGKSTKKGSYYLPGEKTRRELDVPYDNSSYDYRRANQLGYEPDKTGHLPSRDWITGRYLKAPTHPTESLSVYTDLGLGYDVFDKYGNTYSQPNWGSTWQNRLPRYGDGTPAWEDTEQQKAVREWGEDWKTRTTAAGGSKVVQKWNATGKRPKPESSSEYTKRRLQEETKRTWLSDAADVAKGVKEAALSMTPYTAVPYFGAKVVQDILNGNVGAQTALDTAFAAAPFMPKFTLPEPIAGAINSAGQYIYRPIRNIIRRLDRDYGNFILNKNGERPASVNAYIDAMDDVGRKMQKSVEANPDLLGQYYHNQDLQKLRQRLPGFDKLEQELLQNNPKSAQEIKNLFQEFPEYQYFILSTGKQPLSEQSVKEFLELQGRSVRGFHTADKSLVEQNLTEAYPQARSFQSGGDRLRSDGGNYQSNSYELGERFRHTLTPEEGEVGYLGTQQFDFNIPRNLPIQQQLRLYKDQIFNANYFPFDKKLSIAAGRLPGQTMPKIVEAEYMGRGNVKAANERAYINAENNNQFSKEYAEATEKVTKAAETYWKEKEKKLVPLYDKIEEVSRQLEELAQSRILNRLSKNGKLYESYMDYFPNIDYAKANTFAKVEKYTTLKQQFQDLKKQIDFAASELKPLQDEIDVLRANAEQILAPGKKVLNNKKLDIVENITEGHGRWDTANRAEDLFIPVSFGANDMKQYLQYYRKGLFSRTKINKQINEIAEQRLKKAAELSQEGFYVYPLKRTLFNFLYKHGVKPIKRIPVEQSNLDYSIFTGTF